MSVDLLIVDYQANCAKQLELFAKSIDLSVSCKQRYDDALDYLRGLKRKSEPLPRAYIVRATMPTRDSNGNHKEIYEFIKREGAPRDHFYLMSNSPELFKDDITIQVIDASDTEDLLGIIQKLAA